MKRKNKKSIFTNAIRYFRGWFIRKQNELRFNGVCCRNNLSEKNDGLYVIHLDEYVDIGTRWIPLYISNNDAIYFGSFGVKHIPKEI